ncbi:hypothetical protein AJ80_09641 [Polytolypa hystricis UAMH7299]|uniref:DUF6604 domain-containing protein n=1 Tax=Polytolypa hystricis (strain UAMH7299) TaxID=1447883 RepID=A0A2B7WMB7_POLH7|nr:hypothetical protein AJ80_09641 [Polytolypa hystricis UAMH7299]
MADQNTYLKYKRDEKLLVYWIIRTSNRLIQSLSSSPADDAPTVATENTTGQILSQNTSPRSPRRYTAPSNPPSPPAKKLIPSSYKSSPIGKIRKSRRAMSRTNIGFMGFRKRFRLLGGEVWVSSSQKGKKPDDAEEDEDEVIFANKFTYFNIDGEGKEEGEESEGEEGEGEQKPRVAAASGRAKKKPTGKGKKGRKEKNTKSKKPVLLESYRIIQDDTGMVTDYLMADCSIVSQWVEIREYLQGEWRKVAYKGHNSAAAGAVSNIALGIIGNIESQIFVDFPGHDSFKTVMKTITRGDPDKVQGMFQMSLHRFGPDDDVAETVRAVDIDVKEQFLIHAYNDLLDFITDFQKTRTGKPTKTMLAHLD